MSVKINIFLVFVLVFTLGCSFHPVSKNQNSLPQWVLNPNGNGKKGAVGIAGRTYDQSKSSQRKLAITRALDELSLQTGVKVQLIMQKRESSNKLQTHMSMKERSSYKTTSTLNAHIEDIWMDTNSYELYVWLLLDK